MARKEHDNPYRVADSMSAGAVAAAPASPSRIGRVRYTGAILGTQLLTYVALPTTLNALPLPHTARLALLAAFLLLSLVVQLRLSVWRVHDMGRHGGWAAVILLPLLGFALCFLPGTPGPNRYGPMPAAANGPAKALAAATCLVFAAALLSQVNDYREAVERFREYRRNTSPARVVADNHDHAVVAIEQLMADHHASVEAGLAPEPATLPDSAAGWILLISAADRRAPDGGPAYVDGASAAAAAAAADDAVRLSTHGSFAGGDLVVEVARPAIDGAPGERTVLRFEDY